MSAFPETLPLPTPVGYSVDPVPQSVSTDMEVGAARMRRRTKAKSAMVGLSWMLTAEQYQTFCDWFYGDAPTGISGGSSWFDVSLLLWENQLTLVSARFKDGKFKASPISGIDWQVSATLEVR